MLPKKKARSVDDIFEEICNHGRHSRGGGTVAGSVCTSMVAVTGLGCGGGGAFLVCDPRLLVTTVTGFFWNRLGFSN